MRAYDILKSREVSRLCHFTKLQSFTHIVSSPNGILARNSIRQDVKNVIDAARYDGELDFVCCSVEYPNSWFLQKAIESNRDTIFSDWVVLYISLDILNNRKTKFCPCNASKDRGAHIEDKMANIESMFADFVPTFNYGRTARMLRCCPTDGQAEILVRDNIPLEYIIGVTVGNESAAERVYAMFKVDRIRPVPIYLAPDVLTPSWRPMIQQGSRPEELLCDW